MKVVPWMLVAVGVAAVIAGRVETIDLTEGRALIAGWEYWLISLASFLGAVMASKL